MSKKRIGLLMLASLMLTLVSCQQNVPATRVATEAPSDELPTMTVDQLAVAETPSATSSPSPDKLVTATVDQPAVAETPLATPFPSGESMGLAERWQRLDTTGGGGQTGLAFHPTDPNIVYIASDNGGLYKTVNGGETWQEASGNVGVYRLGSVTLDPLDPEVVYVTASTDFGKLTEGGATGEIQRSRDGGESWELVSAEMGFQGSMPNQAAIVIPSGFDRDGDRLSDVVVVGAWTGPADPPVGGIWRSEDEGETFTHLALKDRNITALRAFGGDPSVLFAATYEGEVYRSEDIGESWVDITGNLSLDHPSDLAVHLTDRGTLYVTSRWCRAGEPPVWKTTDGGQNWEAASSGLDTENVGSWPKLWIDRFDAETLYVTTNGAKMGYGSVWKSRDGGQSWGMMPYGMILPDGRPFFYYHFEGEFAIGQAVDGRLFAGDEGAWRYPAGDGRQEWEPVTVGVGNVKVNAIEVDPLDPDVLYQGMADRGPYKSGDGGVTFHRVLGNGWPVTPDNYEWKGPYFTNYEHCVLECSDSCTSSGRQSGGTTLDFAVSGQNPGIVYSAFGTGGNRTLRGGVNKSTDGGATWRAVGFQLHNGFELSPATCIPYGVRHLAMDPADDDVVFAAQENPATGAGKLYRTTDGGATWDEVYTSGGTISEVEVSPADSSLVVLATRGGVYKSERGGEAGSWQKVTPSGAGGIQTLALSPHDAGVFVIGTNNQGLYYTADGGLSWSYNGLEGFFAQEGLGPEVATVVNPDVRMLKNVMAIVFDPAVADTFYIGGSQHKRANVGVAVVTHAGQDWERLPLAGLGHRNVFDLAVDPLGRFLYAGTHGGTYRLELR